MEKMVKRLTAKNIKGTGIVRCEDKDYTYDGITTRVFSYKGVQLRQRYFIKEGKVYIGIDLDANGTYTFKEAKAAGLYSLLVKFNQYGGYSKEFDIYELTDTIDKAIKIHNRLMTYSPDVDITAVKAAAYEAIAEAEALLDEARKCDWLALDERDAKSLVEYAHRIRREIRDEKVYYDNLDKADRAEKVREVEALKENGPHDHGRFGYTFEALKELVEKANK